MKLMVIDGNSIINRAFYGIRLLSTKSGIYTNAIYGFLSILQRLLNEEAPEALCVAFDRREPTFRHKQYDGYKATRSPMPEELAAQLPILKEVLAAMNIPAYELPGYEADDLLGTISKRCEALGHTCVVVTGDRDSLQLVSDKTAVKLVRSKGGQTLTELYDTSKFQEEYGFAPKGLIDLKALMGDSSDNIPGVPGVGEKTAKGLMAEFGSLENVYSNIDTIKDSVKKKLIAGEDSARMSYQLATICCDAPLTFDPAEAVRREPDKKALYNLFIKLEFTKMIEKYGLTPETPGPKGEYTCEITSEVITDIEATLTELETLDHVTVLLTPDMGFLTLCYDCKLWFASADKLGAGFEKLLQEVFSDRVKKNAHNVKELMSRLLSRGYDPQGFVFDTALAAYLLDPSANSYSLDRLTLSYFQTELLPETGYTQLSLTDDGNASMLAVLSQHCGVTEQLYEELRPKLEEEGMLKLFNEIELPLCRVLADMEQAGFRVDKNQLITFGQALSIRIDDIQNQIWNYAGGSFNINSTKQLGEVLFEKLNLPAVKKTKTGYSTNADVLEKLRGRHEIIDLIIEYRTLTKLTSTYVDGLLKVIGPDGRIHSSFNMTATATGRLSSTEPNLQNIPVRTELGAELRKMFIPGDGLVLVDADYSQIELRVLAHMADDKHMIEAFNSGADIHRATAAQVFGVKPEEVTSVMRSRAKAVNFGIVYGISDFSLSEDIGVTRKEAKAYIDSYLENYSGVAAYMNNTVSLARSQGYVTTYFGRKRWLPEINSKNFNIRSAAQRMAMNSPIQGTAADIIKLAMIRVHNALKENGLTARLILQVHDELIVECPRHEAAVVKDILTREMQSVADMAVPLIAEAKSGESWYDAK